MQPTCVQKWAWWRKNRRGSFPRRTINRPVLVGGGAVDAGQVAVILGNSAVVNSSSNDLPQSDELDVMRLNWGPYLWMRCYNNGAQFLDWVVGENPDWSFLAVEGRKLPPGAGGVQVMPFIMPEPSVGGSRLGIPAVVPGQAGIGGCLLPRRFGSNCLSDSIGH